MSLLLDGIQTALDRGDIVIDRLPEFDRLGVIIDRAVGETASYFTNPQVLSANSQIGAKMETVRDMLADAESVPGQAGVLIGALTILLDVLTVDEALGLEQLAEWGVQVIAAQLRTCLEP